ncbi:malonyl-CoA decarboxylase [Elysia marginata]|uniref:Malonyl-CoA decarboxylase n=1 Tax=Elysia marginata TaxID=1093978 RepID=A0AAV4K137_9GAST|nr:malonyl-CoA decarboxylase [Elysia marginata]
MKYCRVLIEKPSQCKSNGKLHGNVKCKEFIKYYGELTADKRGSFLCMLADNYGFDTKKSKTLAAESGKDESETALLAMADKLRVSLQPRHRTLFSLIVRVNGGLQFLINLRADVLGLARQRTNTELQACLYQELNACLRELLTIWFTPSFLDVQRVTWDSPCDLVQQMCKFEAVHPVTSWQDIKRRVGSNRRCFVFTHRSMAGVPVVVLYVGLASEISACLHDLIDKPSICERDEKTAKKEEEDPTKIHASVFYSITSTQKGTGADPVNPLLRVEDLSALAPFKKSSHATPLETFAELVTSHEWCHSQKLQEVMKPILLHLCAHYLYKEKRRNFALNPVANFHLSNGAELWRINFLADTSQQGLDNSCSLMVNYRYFLDAKDANLLNYQQRFQIPASQTVLDLLD